KKVVISHSIGKGEHVDRIAGDIAGELSRLKAQAGKNVMLSCGPDTLRPLVGARGLIDEFLLPVNPVALSSGPRVFDALDRALALKLRSAQSFEGGALVLHYAAK